MANLEGIPIAAKVDVVRNEIWGVALGNRRGDRVIVKVDGNSEIARAGQNLGPLNSGDKVLVSKDDTGYFVVEVRKNGGNAKEISREQKKKNGKGSK